MKTVILDYASLAPEDLVVSPLWELPLQWQVYELTAAEEVDERIEGAHIVLTNKVVISESHLLKNPQLKLIIVMATGTNNVDLQAAAKHGVMVCNIVNYSTPAVVQHTFMLILALTGRLVDYHDDVRAGRWQNSAFFGLLDHQIQEIEGKVLGIVGYGAIGKRVASVADSFGLQVRVANSFSDHPVESVVEGVVKSVVKRYPLNELLPQVDILSIHCPLTEATQNLIGPAELALMKPSACLINVGRGGIVDELALAQALKEGRLAGAGVDVLTQEPPVEGNPLLDENIPNVIITPHNAWGSQQARQRLVNQLLDILSAFCDGATPVNCVV